MFEGERIERLLRRNVEEVIDEKHLREALLSGERLRVKLGIDPTSPDLHLGHAVVLRKLKEFQDLGHQIVLIIGDFTAKIGDPSGRDEARKPLSDAEIKMNMEKYLDEAGKIINVKESEIFHNSSWFTKEGVDKIIELAGATSIQQVLRRADFKKRLKSDKDVSLLEVLYPAFQGYDSVKVRADVELGGTDQTFNLLMGRRIQRHFGIKEQDVLTVPLLAGLDGKKKMSKSLGNYIGLTENPNEMFGKIMSLPDKLIGKYFLLAAELEEAEIKKLKKELSPKDFKVRLGFEIVKLYHGEEAAELARQNFDKLFSKKEIPKDVPIYKPGKEPLTTMGTTATLLGISNSEARRLVEQGAFERNGVVKKDPAEKQVNYKDGETIKIGKKHFFRVEI